MLSVSSAVKGLIGIITAVVLLNTSINYIFDFYGVFGSNYIDKPALKYNQRANKIIHLDALPADTYNAYILGSSRMGMVSAKELSTLSSQYHQTDHRFYNLNVFSGHANDFVLFIEYLVAQNRPIDTLLIGLDMYPFFFKTDYHLPQFRHHPRVSNEDRGFYFTYLFENSMSYLFTDFDVFFGKQTPKYLHNVLDGSYQPLHVLKSLAEAPSEHWENERKKHIVTAQNVNRIGKTIQPKEYQDLQRLMNLIRTHDINARFIITPQHPLIQAFYQPEDYEAFHAMLSEQQVPISDTGLTQQHYANQYFLDAMHFNTELGSMITKNLHTTDLAAH